MPRLSLADRHQAIGMMQAGMSQGEVAAHFQCHRNTISALVRRQRERNDVTDRPISGRPRVTTARQDRWIQRTHLRNRRLTAADTAGVIPGNRRIHPITIRRRLREIGLRPCRPAVRPILTRRHRQVRLQWCRTHVRHPIRWWRFVMFTDESRFQLSRSDGRIRVYRRRNERYADCCIVERDRYGGGSVMVWGGITSQHRTICVIVDGNITGVRYRDEIIQPIVIPFLRQHGPGITFQHDNARPHTARVVGHVLNENNVDVLPWPACSPDLSPIEHVWDEMERRLRHLPQQPTNLQQLGRCLIQVWNDIPQDFHARVIGSMRRRCTAVINAQGGHTRY